MLRIVGAKHGVSPWSTTTGATQRSIDQQRSICAVPHTVAQAKPEHLVLVLRVPGHSSRAAVGRSDQSMYANARLLRRAPSNSHDGPFKVQWVSRCAEAIERLGDPRGRKSQRSWSAFSSPIARESRPSIPCSVNGRTFLSTSRKCRHVQDARVLKETTHALRRKKTIRAMMRMVPSMPPMYMWISC